MMKTPEPAPVKLSPLLDFELEDLPRLGWIRITHIGDENVYFTLPDGREGFAKFFG